jgi:hypothetical protein
MNMKKALGIFAAFTLVAVMSVPVFASEHRNDNSDPLLSLEDNNVAALTKDSAVAQDDAIAVSFQKSVDVDKTVNIDKDIEINKDSHDVKAEEGGIINDDGKVATKGGQIAGDDAVKDSYNTEDSYNKDVDVDVDIEDSFNKHEFEITVGNINTMVNDTELRGEVENNRLVVEHRSELETGDIELRDGAFANATGITTVNQNTGVNSLMQTSVSVNANVK